jgi:hypothetical protein
MSRLFICALPNKSPLGLHVASFQMGMAAPPTLYNHNYKYVTPLCPELPFDTLSKMGVTIMRYVSLNFLIILLIACISSGCGQSSPIVTDDEVLVQTDKLDVRFSRIRPFTGSYMVFGGATLNQSAAFFNISLAALDVNTARSIYAQYPDFDRCKSPGAPLAQQAIDQLDIVPAHSSVNKALKKALALHKKNTEGVSENVCVILSGQILQLRSAVVRDLNEDITSQLPPQVHKEYFLVESVEITRFEEMITAGLR